jgi:hypothetical protein
VQAAWDDAVPGAGAPSRRKNVIPRLIAALDYWILFTVRLSRRPDPWIALHRILSIPLLLRLDRHGFEVEHAGERALVRCRARSAQPGGLLAGVIDVGNGATVSADIDPDLEVVQMHPWSARWRRRRGWLTVPAFVRYRGRLDSIPPIRLSTLLRRNLARARRSGFGRRPGTAADWERARVISESWARVRFGGNAWFPPEHAWTRMRRNGRVIMISDGARDVATAIVVSAGNGGEAWLGPLGIADGDHSLLRAGALTAAYEAAVEEARRSGAAIFDGGRCSARADDTVAAYKRRWGFRPVADPLSPLYALRARTAAGERLLASLPLWVLGPGAELRRVGPQTP